MMLNTIKYIKLLIFVTLTGAVFAQQIQRDSLTQEVEVTKAYKPTILDANKLNSVPQIEETEHQKPNFNYEISSQPVLSNFSLSPLKAATINSSQKEGTGYGLVRAGVGSYFKPYGEVFFNNVSSSNSIFGIHASHLSSFGKIKLEGGDKVDAPFMKNEIELYIKHMFDNSVLSLNLDFKNDAFNYYGYPLDTVPSILLQEDQNISYFGTKQAFNKGGINIALRNLAAEIDEKTIGFVFDYHYFGTKTEQREHFADFEFNYQQPFEVGTGLLDAGVQYNSGSGYTELADSLRGANTQTVVYFKPLWYVGNETANISIGANAWFIFQSDKDTEAKVSPNILANWAPAKEIINLFAGIDGELQSNHYSKIAYENPFVNPDHDIKNAFQKLRFYGGFDGKIAAKTNFKIAAEYAITDNQVFYYLKEGYFFATGTIEQPYFIDNTFAVLHDNMDRLKLNAELFHASSDKLDFLASVNYYSYTLDEQSEAWNMPSWDATLSIGYQVTEQLDITIDAFLMGERKALLVSEPSIFSSSLLPVYSSNTLGTAFDLNVKGNYQLSSNFSVFAQLNNFGFQKYQRWFGYPVQSFNLLAGISYAF